jgi:RNA polymerase sigma factor (sigma-70 family)
MSVCLPYADDREEAAEVLNDGFMKIFKSVKTFDLSRPFEPWFRKIMVNTAINSYRHHRLVIQGEEMEKARHAAEPENTLSSISYQEILDLLRKLPPAYRTVFNLYAIEGYKHEEIAEMLGISVGTSKSNLHRAKEALKKHLNIFFETDYVES